MTAVVTHALAAAIGTGVGILIGVLLTLWATKNEPWLDDDPRRGPEYGPE